MSSEAPPLLVTGGTGYLGRHVVRRLVEEGGAPVHLLARPSSVLPPGFPSEVEVHRAASTHEDLASVLTRVRPGVLVHLAAAAVDEASPEAVDRTLEANLWLGTQLLAQASEEGPVGIVYAGSFFEGDRTRPPWTLYGATKRAFREVVRYYAGVGRARAVGLRLHGIYGPGDPRRKILRLLLEHRGASEPLGLSPGEQVLDWVYLDDVVRAVVRAAAVVAAPDGPQDEVVDVGSGEGHSLRDLVSLLSELAPPGPPVTWGARAYREFEPRREVADVAPAEALLSWRPEVGLREGLARVLAAEEGEPR